MSFFDQDFKEFEIDGYKIRKIDPLIDHENYFFYMNQKEVSRYIPINSKIFNMQSAMSELSYWSSVFKNRKGIYWTIAVSDTNKMVGTLGFNYISLSARKGEISYDLDYNYWGKGIMRKCLALIVDFGFNTIDLCRIQATMAIDNRRSIKLLEKLKFTREGMLRKYESLEFNSENIDAYIYAKVK